MSEAKFTDGPWVACISSNDDGDICTAIKDKGNGNCIVANEIDEDYERLLLAVPEVYKMLEMLSGQLTDINAHHAAKEIDELLAKARGDK